MSPAVGLVLVALLIIANGLFVAAEFSLVAARRGVIEEKAAAGDVRARTVLAQLKNLSFVLSAAQFGITASSLLVGFLAEESIGAAIVDPIVGLFGLGESSSTAVTVGVAFLLSTMVQMVLGELAPKNLAISRPEGVALGTSGSMRMFGLVFGPVIRVFDGAAAWLTRRAGIDVHEELVGGHSLDELSRIIEVSGEEGALSEAQAELLLRAVELGEKRVSDALVPRPDVTFLRADQTLEDLRTAARETGHSRFPVQGDTEDEIVGTVHIKDLLGVAPPNRASIRLGDVVAEPLIVPESERLQRLLGELRRQQRTFAVVVDEYGGTSGIVTLEDVLEELVGDIEDEFDRDVARIRRLGRGRFTVRGTLRADELAVHLGVALPDGDYETAAGLVIDQLGHIPGVGELIDVDGWRIEVTRVEGVRVTELLVRRLPDAPSGDKGQP